MLSENMYRKGFAVGTFSLNDWLLALGRRRYLVQDNNGELWIVEGDTKRKVKEAKEVHVSK